MILRLLPAEDVICKDRGAFGNAFTGIAVANLNKKAGVPKYLGKIMIEG